MEAVVNIGVSKVLAVLGLVIVVDFITGLLAAKLRPDEVVTSKKWNDGLIRKGNMVFCSVSCFALDLLIGIDILPYMPFPETLHRIGFARFGICEAMTLGLICGEVKSIIENWEKAGIVVPEFIKSFIDKLANLFTSDKGGK